MAATTVAIMGSVRNWQSTQACSDGVCCPRWPPQWWCTHSAHVDAATPSADGCTCRDAMMSIGTNTANSPQAASFLLAFVFTAAKLGIFRVMAMGFRHFLSHHYVKYHHQHETNGKANGAEVAVLSAGCFGDEFLDDHVEHGSRGKGQHVGQHGQQQRCQQ